MRKVLLTTALFVATLAANAASRSWNFTSWSEATIANLKADAAASKTEGWSDVEKKADAEADADPTELSKDNCFWYAGTVNEDGSLSANGEVIAELKGLKFSDSYTKNRSLAIAVNYGDVQTYDEEGNVTGNAGFGPYAGPSYLWLGNKNGECIIIPNVMNGTKITIVAESHKISDARGIELYSRFNNVDTKVGESFTPTTQASYTWETEAVIGDIVIKNTNGCHIYSITMEEPAVDITDGTITDGGDLYDIVSQIANVGKLNITLTAGASYTISQPLMAAGDIAIHGNGATVDASGLNGNSMFAKPDEAPEDWTESTVLIEDLNVKGLQNALFYSAAKNTLYTDFTVNNCNVELTGNKTVFDFTKGSVATVFTVTNSTFYAPTATSSAFYSSQSGQKPTEAGDYTQTLVFKNNTMYNLTKAKNFFTHRQSNQTWLAYDVENNIFVNCGKQGQTIKGMNGGQGGSNPTWTITGNAFNFDGADTSANEDTGDADEPVKDSVAGVVTFTDAAAGDFNGNFELVYGTEAPASLGDPRWTLTYTEAARPALLTLKGTVGQEVSIKPGVYGEFDIFSVDFGDGVLVTDSVGHQNKGVCVDDGNEVWPEKEGTTHTGITEFKGTVAGDGTVKVYSDLNNSDLWYLALSGDVVPTTFDQEKLKKVVQMTISKIEVESLDLTGLEAIEIFGFSQGSITSINVSNNVTLRQLTINNNTASAFESKLESLDLSKNENLEQLNVMGASAEKSGKLKALDLTANTKLTNVYAQYNQLAEVKLPAGAELSFVNLQNNQLESIDLSQIESLKDTYLNNNKLNTVDLSKVKQGSNVYVNGNELTELTVPVVLKNFQANDNQLTSINFEGATASCKLENNKFTLATLPAEPAGLNTASKTKKFTYAPQAALEVAETNVSTLDLSAQANVEKGELDPADYATYLTGATTFSFVTASGTALVAGTDYEESAPGVFKFLTPQTEKIHGVMLNAAFPKFTKDVPFVTTEFTLDATVGISSINSQLKSGKVYNLQGLEVKQPVKGLYIQNGRKMMVK